MEKATDINQATCSLELSIMWEVNNVPFSQYCAGLWASNSNFHDHCWSGKDSLETYLVPTGQGMHYDVMSRLEQDSKSYQLPFSLSLEVNE